MRVRLPSLKATAIALVSVIAAYLLFAWLALPPLLQSQAQKYIAEKTGHRLTLDRPEFNPFRLSLRLANLRLEEPDGKPLLAFRSLLVDLSAASLYRRAFVFDDIRLDAPQASVILRTDGRLNWSALIDALKSKEEKPETPLPRLDINHLAVTGGRVDFADERAAFATRVEPLDLELTDISTLPDEKGRYQVTAISTLGARLRWQGEAALNPMGPMGASGSLAIEGLELSRLAPYLKGTLPGALSGTAALSGAYRASYANGKLSLTLDNLAAQLKGLRLQSGQAQAVAIDDIQATNGRYDLGANSVALPALTLSGARLEVAPAGAASRTPLQLGSLAVEDLRADLNGRTASIGRIALKDGQLKATRSTQGPIDLVEALQAVAHSFSKPASEPAAPAGTPWHFKAQQLELAAFSAAFRDEKVKPAAGFAIDDIGITVDNLSDDLKAPLPVRASFRVRDGGSFTAEGQVVPAGPAAEVKLNLADLALKPAQPYLSSVARLVLASGKLSVQGQASYGERGPSFKGGFSLRDLRLTEAGTGLRFLALKSLSTRDLAASTAKLEIGGLALEGLDTELIINKDKSINMARVLRQPEKPAAAPAAPAKAAAPAATPPFLVRIDRLRVRKSELDFADNSLSLPFAAHIHQLRGAINGLSSRPGAPGQVELDGKVDDYGLARAVGQINLFDPADFTDLKVVFRNVEMTRLTPYSATFLGRKIASGKLSLDLEYKVKKRQLVGDNQVVMDQLTLGERVESPEAKDLPLDLAIAILRDSDGRIDLGLPVAGSLDDPQFSYGAIIWKAIVNVITKIVTAPFRALGALFGGGEKLENIAFDPGAARLTPPEREKLVRLAEALGKRPALALTVHGVWADADRVALQERQLRRTVALAAGQHLEPHEDPGPLSTSSPKVQSALEDLYADRIGGGELAALKEGFRKANPGQLEEGAAGKMLSRLTGLFREKRTLSENEVAQLKGADFYGVLFERLRQREPVADEKLQALATSRGENTEAALKEAGAPMDRVSLAAPEKVEATGRDVPVKLVLAPAGKATPAAPPATSAAAPAAAEPAPAN